MPLKDFMTATASTERATLSAGKRGDPTTHLESVSVTPAMLPPAQGQREIRAAIGLDGTAVQIWEIYTESHAHTDNSVAVTQLPDIQRNDRIVIGSNRYTVKWAEANSATSGFGQTLVLYVVEDKRA